MTRRPRATGPRRASGILLALAISFGVPPMLAGCHDETRSEPHGGPPQSAPDDASTSARASDPARAPQARATERIAGEPRQLFFGDLHVHTAWSFDAFDQGVRAEPADAYRFARGEPIRHAAGGKIRLEGPPLDFIAVTDHAEYLGVPTAALRPTHPLHRQPLIQAWIGDDPAGFELASRRIRQTLQRRQPFPALVSDEVLPPAWEEVVAAANAADVPHRFTALVGFEYSANPEFQNLHRNVIFRGAKVPRRPFSAFDSENPEDLWRWMDQARLEGDDLLAIPHNANGSNGLMFATTRADGAPIDSEWASLRARNEPVAEIFQIKGQSDTTPALSPADAWADFEVVPWRTLDPRQSSRAEGSYVRPAISQGLALRATLGVDPFALGVVGSTDTHNAASPVVESSYFGKLGLSDGTPETRLERGPSARRNGAEDFNPAAYWGAAGLAGVWASENTRAGLFDALRRRETFATSGPRIRVRVEARLHDAGAEKPERVPMGATIVVPPDAASPIFALHAQRDPLDAPLERVQIVKLSLDARGRATEAVFDAACREGLQPDPGTGLCPAEAAAAPPDTQDCDVPADRGARELAAEWRDPSFDATKPAAYLVRVLQVPTCRWSTYDARRLGLPPPSELPATIRERALTSPIWILPAESISAQSTDGESPSPPPTNHDAS